ncbi:MAG: hypothetical protein WBJ10_16585, partial [Daejeonella sp.]|uniref:hypothetical protein n=1 Tax=Daejeonella sp. TaxID=2805397 RepID=UPI003C73B426
MNKNIFPSFKTSLLLVVFLFTLGSAQAQSQASISLGARFTANRYPSARVENPSPSNIYGSKHSSIETGIYGLRYFKNERMGIKMGFEFGLIPWDLGIDAPRNAFGTGSGDGELNTSISFNDFSYKA